MTINLFDLLDRREVCRFFGGTRPLNPATLYRGIRKGQFPPPVRAVLDQIEAEQRQQLSESIPDNIPLSELAEQVVRGKVKLSPPQMRMLIELLPFHMPKLSAVALGRLTGNDFASRLDRAVEASNRAKVIEGRVIERED